MQYPIIDLITDAYLNNGWTGLDIIEGLNKANPAYGDPSPYTSRGVVYQRNNNIISVNGTANGGYSYYNTTFTSFADSMPTTNYIGKYFRAITNFPGSIGLGFFRENGSYFSAANNTIIREEAYSFRFFISVPTDITIVGDFTYMIVISDEPIPDNIPYEPYKPPTTDIFSRLKLPLPHYFPHPVIDALQRSAAGTQTADDTEILRHYLTPLGIGGI